MNRKRGFTLIELLVVIAIIALLIGLLLPALAKAQRNARSLKDKTQLKEIHQAMLIFANDGDGTLPTPGLINRLIDPYLNQQLPGTGPEDFLQNKTAPLYSALIAQEFFNPDILIGPTEVNPIIVEDKDYNFDAYQPSQDVYWDPEFVCNLQGSNNEQCNSSYYHLTLIGQRKKIKWNNSGGERDPMLATRGTFRGSLTGDFFTKSQTLLLHGPKKEWVGNVVYGDNHTAVSTSFYPPLVSYEPRTADGRLTKDNIFHNEFNDPVANRSGDAWLGMTRLISEANVVLYREDLLP